MFPEPVVVWLPFTAMLPPMKFMFPATVGVAATVSAAVLFVLPIVSPLFPVNAQVVSNV
jgi:hypothetical protein